MISYLCRCSNHLGLLMSDVSVYEVTAQLWSISTTTMQSRLKVELNTLLFAKTLVRKDIASSAASTSQDDKKDDAAKSDTGSETKEDESEFSSKAQIMTLMTTDVDRVSDFAWHFFAIFGKFRTIPFCLVRSAQFSWTSANRLSN